jgi:hypothetical protein
MALEQLDAVDGIITKLNHEIYDLLGDYEFSPYLELSSTGDAMGVEFLGFCLWSSECDERAEVGADLEPLEPFLRRRIGAILPHLAQLQALAG